MDPICGAIDQFTAVLEAPLTLAVNCTDLVAASEMDCGDRVTEPGKSITIALADLVGSATLVAVMVIAC